MKFNWKHVLLVSLGAAVPVLFASLDAQPITWATAGQSVATAGAVFWATAVRSWLPSSHTSAS
ncbi:MAG TPA: hypothetical protein VMI75_31135 [Polyangiaceae bacterium]|nr:hypothetical protein [Polyangiaceae bacterium]